MRFDPGLLVRHFTAVKVRQVTASEHEILDPFRGGLLPAISPGTAGDSPPLSNPQAIVECLRVIDAIRSSPSIVMDFMSLDHSIEGLAIYFENACGSLLVASRVREHSRDVTSLDCR